MHLDYPVLTGRFVSLEPLTEQHRDGLRAAAEADPEIWDLFPFSMVGEYFDPYWRTVMRRAESGDLLAYAAMRGGDIVGVTTITPDRPNRVAEIGGTYYRPDVRGTAINPESKRLLMAHLFDCGAIRVGYKVDALNLRSRAAVLKLGARQDGILRAERITWTGRVRDTVVFSILAGEWPPIRARLDERLRGYG